MKKPICDSCNEEVIWLGNCIGLPCSNCGEGTVIEMDDMECKSTMNEEE